MLKNISSSALMLIAFLLPAAAFTAESSLPNILILYADDLGYGDLGCYNPDSKIPTPNLDRLAQEGMLFTDGHSSSGICTPSRYAMLTGRHHWRKFHGIVSTFGESVFDKEELTLPEMLKQADYATAVIGKWHLGWDWSSILKPGTQPIKAEPYIQRAGEEPTMGSPRTTYALAAFDWSKPIADGPLDHGFDYYFGDTVINFPPYCWIENDRVTETPDRMVGSEPFRPLKEGSCQFRPGPMVSGWDPYDNIPVTTEKGVEKIHELAKGDKPFFLFFSFPSPHAPIIPNNEFIDKSDAGPYGDHVVETDAACGKLLKALADAGVADNTIVFFSSDNGPEWFAYEREDAVGHWSSEPLRGVKQDIYEGGHRVPFILKWPGVIPAGSVSHALVSQIDLMATLAEIVDVELPDDQAIDSFNLMPILRGDKEDVRTMHVHNTKADYYAIRQGDWVLINCETGYNRQREQEAAWNKKHGYVRDDGLPVELYNLSEDISQRHNLAEAHPERVSEMQAMLKQIREQGYPDPH